MIETMNVRVYHLQIHSLIKKYILHFFYLQAPSPLDFDGFVKLLGYQTLELDSEETLIQALSRWDKDNSGYISEERYWLFS